jgi:hypothetical protein
MPVRRIQEYANFGKEKLYVMEHLEKLNALEYIIKNNHLCTACNRANIYEIRIAAGLYLELADIILGNEKTYTIDELAERIKKAGAF